MKVISKTLKGAFLSLPVLLLSVGTVFADVVKPGLVGNGGDDLQKWAITVLNFVIGIAGLIAVALIIVNGIMFITASGDEQKIAKAQKAIMYAIVGLVVAAISFLLVNFVINRIIGA